MKNANCFGVSVVECCNQATDCAEHQTRQKLLHVS